MKLGLIWAQAIGGAIGRHGDMPWHLPEDLAHFKQSTLGHPVIMGRKTWESLPQSFRPLSGRQNIVVSRDPHFHAPGASVVNSLKDALLLAQTEAAEQAWVIGGGQLYETAMPIADELVVTQIDYQVSDADTFAPKIDDSFELTYQGEKLTSENGLNYHFEHWRRRHDNLVK